MRGEGNLALRNAEQPEQRRLRLERQRRAARVVAPLRLMETMLLDVGPHELDHLVTTKVSVRVRGRVRVRVRVRVRPEPARSAGT